MKIKNVPCWKQRRSGLLCFQPVQMGLRQHRWVWRYRQTNLKNLIGKLVSSLIPTNILVWQQSSSDLYVLVGNLSSRREQREIKLHLIPQHLIFASKSTDIWDLLIYPKVENKDVWGRDILRRKTRIFETCLDILRSKTETNSQAKLSPGRTPLEHPVWLFWTLGKICCIQLKLYYWTLSFFSSSSELIFFKREAAF